MSEDCEDAKTTLMQRVGKRPPVSGMFSWPQHDDVSWILFHRILCAAPEARGRAAHQYKILKLTLEHTSSQLRNTLDFILLRNEIDRLSSVAA